MKQPVLLLAYNRPELTAQVLEQIRLYAPKRIYVSVDGAKSGDLENQKLVAETKDVISSYLTWDCEVIELYNPENTGCRTTVRSAIDYFFSRESEGIILEDDCVPHPDFFPFMELMLDTYRNESRIFGASGDNSMMVKVRSGSYGLGRYSVIWGWASWADRWQMYRANLEGWPESSDKVAWVSETEKKNYTRIFDQMLETGKPDSWAYPLTYTVLVNDGRWIIPKRNLVSNKGFSKNATHTKDPNHFRSNSESDRLGKIKHPRNLEQAVDQIEFMRRMIAPKELGFLARTQLAKRVSENKAKNTKGS